MSRLPESFHELQAVFDCWSESLQNFADNAERIAYIGKELPQLLSNRPVFAKILSGIVKGRSYPDVRQTTLFGNEFILYINNQRLFSVRLYIYEPGQYTPVHDHNSWGVYGCVSKKIEVIRYRREDDETRPGYAHLAEIDRPILLPGETTSVLPLNDGIHRAGNPTDQTALMLSVYGTPIRRLFINQYDPLQNRVEKRYPPRLRKKMLAAQALEAINGAG